jgi:serine phosphatase RsbU (regulator of sigma subunit)
VLIAYTDGLIEARNQQGEMLSIETVIPAIRTWEPLEALKVVEDQLVRHVDGRLSDDLTILAMTRRED